MAGEEPCYPWTCQIFESSGKRSIQGLPGSSLAVVDSHDPLSAEYVLCLGAGPLSGASLAMSGRIQAVERAFNIRRGITREDDRLPQKPESKHTREGETDLEKHELMLEEYYRVQGYDPETGMPTRRRLVALNLEDVADALEADAPYPRWEGPPLWSPEQYPKWWAACMTWLFP